jgi:hypothetical protein
MNIIDYTALGALVNLATQSDTAELPPPSMNDVDAIGRFLVEITRINSSKYPELIQNLQDYSTWRDNLSWYAQYMDTTKTVGEAKYYRNKANEIMNQQIPQDYDTVGSTTTVIVPIKNPTPTWWDKIPTGYKIAGTAGGSAIIVLVLLKRLHLI